MVAVLAVFASLSSAQLTQPAAERRTGRQISEDLSLLERSVRAEWSYYDMRASTDGVDLSRLVQNVTDRLKAGATRARFHDELRVLVAALHDGHAGLSMPGVPTLQKRRMPLNVRDCREGLIVSRVAGATQAADGPRVGDRLIAVNGSKMEDIVARSQSIVFGSTPGMRRALAVREALWIERESAQVDLEAPDGARRRVTLAAAAGVPDDLQPPRKGHPPALDWPRKRVARLTIPSFAVGDWGAWLKATVEQRDGFLVESKKQLDAALDAVVDGSAEALILDLRGNDGGTDLLGIHLAQRLLSEPFIYFRLSTKLNGKWLQPGGLTYQPRKRHVSARLVALVDEGVFSTADNLLRCLRDHRTDLVVVGRPTGAGTGAPREIARLPHSGAIVTLCTHRVFGPTSGLIEGAGTAPDVAVTWTRLDVIKNRDPDLNAALEDVRPSR